MTTTTIELLKSESNSVRQLGNHVFARNADLISVYEVLTYEDHAPKTLKDLSKTYLLTDRTTWYDIEAWFFGPAVAPSFTKTLKV